MPAPLGIDIAGVHDVDRYLSFADPGHSAADAVSRGLFHAPGALWWAPDLGFHLGQLLHGTFDADRIENGIKQQIETDERVESVEVSAESLGSETRVTIVVVFTGDPAATTLTITADQAGNVILENAS